MLGMFSPEGKTRVALALIQGGTRPFERECITVGFRVHVESATRRATLGFQLLSGNEQDGRGTAEFAAQYDKQHVECLGTW